MQFYEEVKDRIRKPGNTAAINKARERAWQQIADRLNAQVSKNDIIWKSIKRGYIFQLWQTLA